MTGRCEFDGCSVCLVVLESCVTLLNHVSRLKREASLHFMLIFHLKIQSQKCDFLRPLSHTASTSAHRPLSVLAMSASAMAQTTASSTASPPIERLPTELVDQIASSLAAGSKQDVGALRLVSKWMLKNTQLAVSDGLFGTVRCSVTFDTLMSLVRIAKHPTFGPAVRVLELYTSYHPHNWCSYPRAEHVAFAKEAGACGHSCDAEHTPHCVADEIDGKEFLTEASGMRFLAIALNHLPNLRDTRLGLAKNYGLLTKPDSRHSLQPWA